MPGGEQPSAFSCWLLQSKVVVAAESSSGITIKSLSIDPLVDENGINLSTNINICVTRNPMRIIAVK